MVRVVRSERECHVLAELLLSPDRGAPVAVVSTRQGSDTALVDVSELEARLVEVAEVYLVVTGPSTYTLADLVGDRATVYGGASRVYPVGVDWLDDPFRSPLRFCYEPADAQRTLDALVADAERFASAGLIAADPTTAHTPFAQFAETLLAAVGPAGSDPEPRPEIPTGSEAAGDTSKPSPDDRDRRDNEPPSDPVLRIAWAATRRLPVAEPASAAESTATASPESLRPDRRHALRDALATIDSLKATITRERIEACARLHEALDRGALEAAQLEAELRLVRDRLRDAGTARPRATARETSIWEPDAFVDARDAVREAVRRQWVAQIPSYEKSRRPLPEHLIGDRFASSFANLNSPLRAKTLRCIVEVLLAKEGERVRDAHLMSDSGVAGGSIRVRDDGAKLWRAYVETKAPGARRLHFWRLPGGLVELSRVVHHDDYEP